MILQYKYYMSKFSMNAISKGKKDRQTQTLNQLLNGLGPRIFSPLEKIITKGVQITVKKTLECKPNNIIITNKIL